MLIKCSWCGKEMGEKPPLEDKRTSHGICKDCYDRVTKSSEAPKEPQVSPSVPRK